MSLRAGEGSGLRLNATLARCGARTTVRVAESGVWPALSVWLSARGACGQTPPTEPGEEILRLVGRLPLLAQDCVLRMPELSKSLRRDRKLRAHRLQLGVGLVALAQCLGVRSGDGPVRGLERGQAGGEGMALFIHAHRHLRALLELGDHCMATVDRGAEMADEVGRVMRHGPYHPSSSTDGRRPRRASILGRSTTAPPG